MSDETTTPPATEIPPYEEVLGAPIVYFDIVAANGIFNGAVQIELAARALTPIPGTNDVAVRFFTSARLRCSPVAAMGLRDALNNSIQMVQQPPQTPSSAGTLN